MFSSKSAFVIALVIAFVITIVISFVRAFVKSFVIQILDLLGHLRGVLGQSGYKNSCPNMHMTNGYILGPSWDHLGTILKPS